MLELVLTIIFLLVILVKSADIIEDAFIAISERFNINTFLTGFIILAFTSSLPETSVAINAIVEDAVPLSIGNLLGATTVILTFIIGLNAIKNRSIPFKGFFGKHEVILSLGVILAQVAAIIDRRLTVLEGVLLLSLYVVFILYIVFKSNSAARSIPKRKKRNGPVYMHLLKSAVGVVGLIWSANILVEKAILLAGIANIPEILIGLFMLSLGTNLPEIILLIRSNSVEKEKLAAGNFIGSATFNTAVMGILAILSPYNITNFSAIVTVIIFLTIGIVLLANMVTNDEEITFKEGYLLVILFFALALIELFVSRHI